MTLSKGAVGNLVNRYRAVLKKCHLMNVFGSLAVAALITMGGSVALAASDVAYEGALKDISSETTFPLLQHGTATISS